MSNESMYSKRRRERLARDPVAVKASEVDDDRMFAEPISGVLEHPHPLSKEDAERIKEAFEGMYKGTRNADRPEGLTLPHGMKFTPFTEPKGNE